MSEDWILETKLKNNQEPTISFLDSQFIDWESDFEAAAEQSRSLLRYLCSDKQHIQNLFERMEKKPDLLSKAENHQLLDYFVLYDALDRGIRLRLHLSTSEHLQRPHDHRFDFSSYILCGSYQHCLITPTVNPYELTTFEDALPYQDKDHPDSNICLKNENFPEQFVCTVEQGKTLSLSHQAVHTVYTKADTVSLVMRGPARKSRSLIFDRNQEKLWWRFGQKNETSKRRTSKIFSVAQFERTKKRLSNLGIL